MDWRPCALGTKAELHVFIGQSNMVGWNTYDDYPRCKDTSANAPYAGHCLISSSRSELQNSIDTEGNVQKCEGLCDQYITGNPSFLSTLADNATGQVPNTHYFQRNAVSFVPVQPGLMYGGYASSTIQREGCTPLINFANLMETRAPGIQRYYLNMAVGGSSITHWQKGDAKAYYDNALTAIQSAIALIPDDYEIAGFYWKQGEKDAGQSMTASEYQTNFGDMIADFETDLGVTIPVFDSKVREYGNGKAETINAAKQTMRDTNITKVLIGDAGALGGAQDSVHYCPIGYAIIGADFAEAFLTYKYGYKCYFTNGAYQADDAYALH